MLYAEALNLKALARSQFGKQTLDAAWGEFLSVLAWVCRKRGVYFEQVEATYT
ncbi:MAG: transposase, partial [Cyanobacteria bacterium QS_8_64_29]